MSGELPNVGQNASRVETARPLWFGPLPEGTCPAWTRAYGAVFECRLAVGHDGSHSDPVWGRQGLAPPPKDGWEHVPRVRRSKVTVVNG